MSMLLALKKRFNISAVFVLAVYLILLIRLVWFVHLHSVNVLFWDQWDFLSPVFSESSNLWEIFSLQHGPHRQGLGGLVLAFLYPLSAWDVRVEAFLALGIMAVSCWMAIIIKKRLWGKIHWTDAAIPFIYFTLLQYEIFIGTPNPAHGPLPVFLVTSTAFVLTMDKPIVRAFALALLVFFAAYTGFAIFSAIPVMIILLIISLKSPSSKIRIFNGLGFLLSLIFFVSFFINYQHAPAVDCFQFPHPQPFEYLEFSVFQFGAAFGLVPVATFPFTSWFMVIPAGFLFLSLLAACVFFAYKTIFFRNIESLPMFYLTAFTLLFITFTAIGRVCLGVEASRSSRYIAYATPGILALYFLVLIVRNQTKLKPQLKNLIFFGFFTLMIFKELAIIPQTNTINWYTKGKEEWVKNYLEYHDIKFCDSVSGFKVYPDERSIQAKMEYLESKKLNFFKNQNTE